jgi:hypothetical protein
MHRATVFCLLFIVACGGGGSSPTEPGTPAGGASLDVRVHRIPPAGTTVCNDTDCPPLAGAMVTVQGKTGTTGADGRVTISQLASGPTTVTITRTGYQNFTGQLTLTSGSNTASLAMTPEVTAVGNAVCRGLRGCWVPGLLGS